MRPDALDFWIGEWDCTWDGGGGVNRITRELDDAVVVERFETSPPETFSGMSVSVYDPDAGWRQTWVDTDANYWSFVGSEVEDQIVFATPFPVDRQPAYKRMVFSGIGPGAFHWRWESSLDGVAWTERWAIEYRRRGRAGLWSGQSQV